MSKLIEIINGNLLIRNIQVSINILNYQQNKFGYIELY